MKKTLPLILLLAVSCTACHKDCVCKYYKNDKFYDMKVWDDRHITEEDCQGMNDSRTVEIPLGDYGEVELADYKVICSRD
ncbi:MAG: hypothetical protein J5642_05990 [Bacteroidales bacterium]|nr:hypothetical protein [Bacteroidales bacterium]